MRSNNRRITQTATQLLFGTPRDIFPLLCPVREYEWIEHWSCAMLYSDSGYAENNCMFSTRFQGDESDDIWVVCQYEPDEEIQFIRMNASRVMRYSIRLTERSPGRTEAVWNQIITALNDEADKQMGEPSQEEFAALVAELESALNHYLKTGRMLRHQEPA